MKKHYLLFLSLVLVCLSACTQKVEWEPYYLSNQTDSNVAIRYMSDYEDGQFSQCSEWHVRPGTTVFLRYFYPEGRWGYPDAVYGIDPLYRNEFVINDTVWYVSSNSSVMDIYDTEHYEKDAQGNNIFYITDEFLNTVRQEGELCK